MTLVDLTELAQDELEAWELVGDARPAQLGAPRRGGASSAPAPAPRSWCCGCAAATARASSSRPTCSSSPSARSRTSPRKRAGSCRTAEPAARRRGPAGDRRAPLIPSAPMATCYRHPIARDRRLVFLLRAADLPGLHDADLGRHALPGVRARAHQGQDGAQRASTAPRGDPGADRDQRARCSSARPPPAPRWAAGIGGIGTLYDEGRPVRAATSTRCTTSTAGWSPAASCTTASCTSPSTCSSLYFLGAMLEPAIGRAELRRRLLRLAAGGLVRRAAVLSPAPTVGASGASSGSSAR